MLMCARRHYINGVVPLQALPPTVYEDLVLTVQLSDGRISTKSKRFQRAPLPAIASNVTRFTVDHSTAGMLVDGWLPFTALGWFNSPFEYAHESVGDMSLISASVPMVVARGGSFAVEWGKKGQNLIRIGCDHDQEPGLLLAILDECERAGVYAMYTPRSIYTLATKNDTQSLLDLKSNMSLVMQVVENPP